MRSEVSTGAPRSLSPSAGYDVQRKRVYRLRQRQHEESEFAMAFQPSQFSGSATFCIYAHFV